MSDTIQPALTPQEWACGSAIRNGIVMQIEDGNLSVREDNTWSDEYTFQYWDRDTLAALALYEQSFGFTREDVLVLRGVALQDHPSLNSLADRIEALLPPITNTPKESEADDQC